MLGKSHLLVGAAGYLTIGQTLLVASGHKPTAAEMICGVVVCAGAAMLPDIDHPQATVSRALGPVTQELAKVVAKICGGHRKGTHSLLFALACVMLANWGFSTHFGRFVEFGLAFFFTSLCVQTLTEAGGAVSAAISGGVASVMIMATTNAEWLALAIGLGCLLHIAADFVTTDGVAIMWPLSKQTFRFPIVGRTGGRRERIVAVCSGLLAVWVYAQAIVLPVLMH